LAKGAIISVQSLNEFAAVARRKLKMSWREVREFSDLICVLCPEPVSISLETHRKALALAQKYGYGIYDALQLSAALECECKVLFSEDFQDGQVVDGKLTIRNPFA